MLRNVLPLRLICKAILFLLLFFPFLLSAEEEILLYQSFIAIADDGDIVVKEVIKVRSEQNQIKRGIFRDIPTHRQVGYGFLRGSTLRVLSVMRDGVPERYALEDIQGDLGGDFGKRIRIGKKEVILPSGIYTYTIEYKSTNQIDFFERYDQLFWNVTGNGWSFPIRKAEAYISLPDGIHSDDVTLGGFTGKPGSKEQRIVTSKRRGDFFIGAERSLYYKEGLSVLIQWPKGFVLEPSEVQKWRIWITDNKGSVFGILGLLFVLTYYYLIWNEVGRDPEGGSIIPQYESPDDLSPASLRYLSRMGFDKKALTAEILQMAVQGYLTIEKEGMNFVLRKTGEKEESLTPRQVKITSVLFDSGTSITLKQSNHKNLQRAIKALHNDLKTEHLKRHFFLNKKYFTWGVTLSFVVVLLATYLHSAQALGVTFFMSIWLSGWSFGVFALVSQAWDSWRRFFAGEALMIFGAIFTTLFALPFVAGWFLGAFFFISASTVFLGGVTIVLGIAGYIFYHLLKAPTRSGKKLMDRIEGLKLYLGVAEQEYLHAVTPPKKTPEVFEKFLPYALALDVEQEWSEKFAEVLHAASQGQAADTYNPHFYRGSDFTDVTSLSSSISNSFSSALSSASTAPRSSGSGGGGFSGGGGGGGGGGGW